MKAYDGIEPLASPQEFDKWLKLIPVWDAEVPRVPTATEILQKPPHTPDHFAIHCQAKRNDKLNAMRGKVDDATWRGEEHQTLKFIEDEGC